MATEADMDRISEEISRQLAGLELGDVASILIVQLAMLVTQGTETQSAAIKFLNDIRDSAEGIVKTLRPEEGQDRSIGTIG